MIRVCWKADGIFHMRLFSNREEYWEWLDNYRLQNAIVSIVVEMPLSMELLRRADDMEPARESH